MKLALAIAAALGCGHDAKPVVQPDDHPPLPPGTPIGYLIDDASELKLSDDQLTQLKTIDADLASRLDVLDAKQHGDRPRSPDSSQQQTRRRGGGRRGGMGGMGGMGGRGGRGMGGNRGSSAGSGSGRPAPPAGGNADAASRTTEERADDVRDALARAFSLLDPTQREIARRILDEHGVDVDAGRSPGTQPEPGQPREPDTGSDGT